MTGKLFIFVSQIATHISIIFMILWASYEHYLVSLMVFFFTGCVGMSMTYHRLLAHNSWTAPRWFEILGTLCASVGLTGSSLAWCSVHREHHQNTDKPNDPHTPIHSPWWKVQFLSMFHAPNLRFMKYKLQDPLHKLVHKHYIWIQLIYLSFLILLEPFSVVYAYLFPAAILWNSGSAVNTIGHLFGYTNFQTKDNSKNNLLLALLTWGEGWHNNHHHRPQNKYFGVKWYEIDIAGLCIIALQKYTK